ncbi:NAD-P-binding protein [Peniophora sp. CONT]|nr:NAD-P-binding protein [Peniophora sp. CONT]
MSGYKTFAVVGAGLIGGVLTDELLKAKSAGVIDKVVVLTRPGSVDKLDAYAARGASIVAVEDYSSVPDVTKALAGIDVVISTLAHNALDLQLPIAEAAKAADVQLFVPSEYGLSTDGHTEGALARKAAIDAQIRASGLATTRFFIGMFADTTWHPLFDLDLKSGSGSIGGDGTAEISFTSCEDISRFVVHALTNLPREEVKNRTFRIEAERTSLNDIFAAYEKKHDVKLKVTYISIDELKEKIAKNPHDFVSFLHLAWATGVGTVGSPLDNDVFPDWHPKPVLHYL